MERKIIVINELNIVIIKTLKNNSQCFTMNLYIKKCLIYLSAESTKNEIPKVSEFFEWE
jgi:hypothetical protein